MRSSLGVEQRTSFETGSVNHLPRLLSVDEAADLLRTTRRAIYAMIERRQLRRDSHPSSCPAARRRPATLAGPEAPSLKE